MLRYLYETILESLFPLSPIEKELFSYSTDEVLRKFAVAPAYTGLAVLLPEGHSLFAYKDKLVEKLIWSIKYKRSDHAVKIGAQALLQYLISTQNRDVLVIPIPITKQRRRERGYNQCELLTGEMKRLHEEWKNVTPIPAQTGDGRQEKVVNTICTNFVFENNLLIRTHHDSRHTLKGRIDRVESAKGIFEVDEKLFKNQTYDFKNSRVIIIDDVITTGSTMREAIDTMKKSGFKDVSGLSLAH